MKYANLVLFSDVEPYEVVKEVSEKSIDIRRMEAELNPDWIPEFYAGGFCAHVANNDKQEWLISSNEQNGIIRIRKHKNGDWKDRNGNRYVLGDKPIKKYDYNF